MTVVICVPWSDSYHNNCFETQFPPKNLEIIMLETRQGMNLMGHSATLSDYKTKQLLTTHKNFTNILNIRHKKLASD